MMSVVKETREENADRMEQSIPTSGKKQARQLANEVIIMFENQERFLCNTQMKQINKNFKLLKRLSALFFQKR